MRVLSLLKNGFSGLLWFLVVGLRPLLGPPAACKFTMTCTQFALHEFEHTPIFTAILNVSKRLLSCHGFIREPL